MADNESKNAFVAICSRFHKYSTAVTAVLNTIQYWVLKASSNHNISNKEQADSQITSKLVFLLWF